MATAELSAAAPRRRSELGRAWLRAYVDIWAATLGAAAAVAVITPLKPVVRHLLRLHLHANATPAPNVGRIVGLAAHNVPLAAWPIVLGVVGAHRSRVGVRAADCVLATWLAVNMLPVGWAVGAYGPPILAYVPHLPFEWAALALGASGWLLQRRRALTLTQGLTLLALTSALVLCAATVETLAVPHGHLARRPATARAGSVQRCRTRLATLHPIDGVAGERQR
jgi:hypothetical protein